MPQWITLSYFIFLSVCWVGQELVPVYRFEAENMIPLGPEETLGAELDKASPAHCLPTGAAVLLALQIVVTSLYLLFHFLLSHCQEHL